MAVQALPVETQFRGNRGLPPAQLRPDGPRDPFCGGIRFGDGRGALSAFAGRFGINRRALESVIESRLPISKNLWIDSRCFFDGAHKIIVPISENGKKRNRRVTSSWAGKQIQPAFSVDGEDNRQLLAS
jgi:hypothetical protein